MTTEFEALTRAIAGDMPGNLTSERKRLEWIAKKLNISVTLVKEHRRLADEAKRRGVEEEFTARIWAGESKGSVVKDLMPEIYFQKQRHQTCVQFKSTVKKLLGYGYNTQQLVNYIELNFTTEHEEFKHEGYENLENWPT